MVLGKRDEAYRILGFGLTLNRLLMGPHAIGVTNRLCGVDRVAWTPMRRIALVCDVSMYLSILSILRKGAQPVMQVIPRLDLICSGAAWRSKQVR